MDVIMKNCAHCNDNTYFHSKIYEQKCTLCEWIDNMVSKNEFLKKDLPCISETINDKHSGLVEEGMNIYIHSFDN